MRFEPCKPRSRIAQSVVPKQDGTTFAKAVYGSTFDTAVTPPFPHQHRPRRVSAGTFVASRWRPMLVETCRNVCCLQTGFGMPCAHKKRGGERRNVGTPDKAVIRVPTHGAERTHGDRNKEAPRRPKRKGEQTKPNGQAWTPSPGQLSPALFLRIQRLRDKELKTLRQRKNP